MRQAYVQKTSTNLSDKRFSSHILHAGLNKKTTTRHCTGLDHQFKVIVCEAPPLAKCQVQFLTLKKLCFQRAYHNVLLTLFSYKAAINNRENQSYLTRQSPATSVKDIR